MLFVLIICYLNLKLTLNPDNLKLYTLHKDVQTVKIFQVTDASLKVELTPGYQLDKNDF